MQVLRTYPDAHFEYDFAPHGERSVARGYSKAVRRARRLIYLEDQYLWSKRGRAGCSPTRCRDNPDLHLVVVVPRYPDVDGRLALPPNMIGRRQAIETCRQAGPDRVHVFDVENHEGTPVYVHAKVCVIDDVWACVGSDNFNRRSWTHDSELSCAVLDDTGEFARDLRLRLMREHLDRTVDDRLVDPLPRCGRWSPRQRLWTPGMRPAAAGRDHRAGCGRTNRRSLDCSPECGPSPRTG